MEVVFTGIIEEVGIIKSLIRERDSLVMGISGKKVLENTILGDSIAINGVCQTVTKLGDGFFHVDVMAESLNKTTLGSFRVGKKVNLERAMTLGKPFGGHIVQGHVQGMGKVLSMVKTNKNHFLKVSLNRELMEFVVKEGSIAIDGLSLTIAHIKGDSVEVNIIPHTIVETTIGDLKTGDFVNIEPDILIKANKTTGLGLTREKLLEWGY